MSSDNTEQEKNILSISFIPIGRTGNNIFQYITCKLICAIYNKHKYVSNYEEVQNKNHIVLTDNLYQELITSPDKISNLLENNNILCNGYFQQHLILKKYRKEILEILSKSDDILYHNIEYFRKDYMYFNNFIKTICPLKIEPDDIIMAVRLDDFLHYDSPGDYTDILPITFYTNILDNTKFNKLYIICDKLRKGWEFDYINSFKKYNPILIQGSLESDISFFLESKRIIHSNSTLCWIMSFLSEKSERYIPVTNYCKGMSIEDIEEKDYVYKIDPLKKNQININSTSSNIEFEILK